MNATVKTGKKHFPVMLNELLSIISPLYSGTFIDCTFGEGEYSKAILKHPGNKVIAIDRDKKTLFNAKNLKEKYKDKFYFKNIKFREINKINIDRKNVKAIIFDLGYSANQIQDSEKGLSFNSKGKLNMQMGLNNFSAHQVINYLEKGYVNDFFQDKELDISHKANKLLKGLNNNEVKITSKSTKKQGFFEKFFQLFS